MASLEGQPASASGGPSRKKPRRRERKPSRRSGALPPRQREQLIRSLQEAGYGDQRGTSSSCRRSRSSSAGRAPPSLSLDDVLDAPPARQAPSAVTTVASTLKPVMAEPQQKDTRAAGEDVQVLVVEGAQEEVENGEGIAPSSPEDDANLVAMGESLIVAGRKGQTAKWEAAMGPCPVEHFKVRDFGYLESKLKVESAPALFSHAGADCVLSAGPLHHFCRRVRFPPCAEEEAYSSPVVPFNFVVNMMIPMKSKALMGGKKKSAAPTATINAVYYFRMTAATQEAVRRLDEHFSSGGGDMAPVKGVPPAVAYLYRWCRDAAHDDVLNGCFKTIGIGFNFKEVGAPSFVSQYNGKPVLMAATGKKNQRKGFTAMHRGANYLECSIDMAAHFSYLAQKGLVWGVGQCEKLDTAIAFVLEGRGNHELPECVLGCLKQRFVPLTEAVDEKDYFREDDDEAPGLKI